VRDRRVLYTAAFLRALATGTVGVLVGLYLAKLGLGSAEIGLVVGAGLLSAALAALLVTLIGDRVSQLKAQVALSLFGAAGLLAVVVISGVGPLAAAAFLGMLNGMGRDRGASLILDQASLPATAAEAERTPVFA
jgi:MFS family permease